MPCSTGVAEALGLFEIDADEPTHAAATRPLRWENWLELVAKKLLAFFAQDML
ncbi:MAG: hypothetical protein ACREC9_09315 [Methylocella sp.]